MAHLLNPQEIARPLMIGLMANRVKHDLLKVCFSTLWLSTRRFSFGRTSGGKPEVSFGVLSGYEISG